MTWADIKAYGSGKITGFALVIEGWPTIFVTNPAITVGTDAGSRTVIAGLLGEGIRFRERAIPREGRYEADAITFRFRPPYGHKTSSGTTDPITQSFARRGAPVAALDGTLMTHLDTSLSLQGASTLSDSTFYHIGTEVIRVTTFPTITRGHWGSTPQGHFPGYVNAVNDVAIYDHPTTMDGRRVWLYIYGDGDSVLTLNADNIVWRGIVTRPPSREHDGLTWAVHCSHVSHALRQSLVGDELEVKIVGLYHHRLAPVGVQINHDGDNSSYYWLAGFFLTPEALCAAINEKIDDAIAELAIASSSIAQMTVQYNTLRQQYILIVRTGSGAPGLFIPQVGSLLIGVTDYFYAISDTDEPTRHNELENNRTYRWALELPVDAAQANGATIQPPSMDAAPTVVSALGGPRIFPNLPDAAQPADDDPIHDYPEWRLYVDHDFDAIDLGAGTWIYIGEDEVVYPADIPGALNTKGGGTFEVVTVDEDGDGNKYIEVVPDEHRTTLTIFGQFRGFLTATSVIRPMVNYSTTAASTYDVLDFIGTLVDYSIAANQGIVPFIIAEDFDFTDSALPVLPDPVRKRVYQFVRSESIDDVLAQELLLSGSMLYTTTAGKLAVRPLPVFTDVHVTTKTIDGNKVVTPAGTYGSWPGYEQHPQGIVSVVRVKQGYNPVDGEWTGRSYEARDQDLISRHKKRGMGNVEISPRSNAAGGDELDLADVQVIAGVLFALAGREYAAVKVRCAFTAFEYLLGDIVSLTNKHTPNAQDGTTGLTGKRAVVMSRSWNFDPRVEEWGELELWILLDTVAGYAPSAVITAQADQGSNLWNLTCSVANALNVLLSTNGDGQQLAHFADGDYVRAVQVNHISNQQTGRITGTPSASGGTCAVQFDGAWTPGSDTWVLEFQADNGSTAQSGQRLYTYVADNDKKLATGTYSRVFT